MDLVVRMLRCLKKCEFVSFLSFLSSLQLPHMILSFVLLSSHPVSSLLLFSPLLPTADSESLRLDLENKANGERSLGSEKAMLLDQMYAFFL
jgi:hypothetical protein